MDCDCDIFERLPDGVVLWRASAMGKDAVLAKLAELAKQTTNELFARDLFAQVTIARTNVSTVGGASRTGDEAA